MKEINPILVTDNVINAIDAWVADRFMSGYSKELLEHQIQAICNTGTRYALRNLTDLSS